MLSACTACPLRSSFVEGRRKEFGVERRHNSNFIAVARMRPPTTTNETVGARIYGQFFLLIFISSTREPASTQSPSPCSLDRSRCSRGGARTTTERGRIFSPLLSSTLESAYNPADGYIETRR